MSRPHFEPPEFDPARPGLVAPVRLDPTGLTGPTRGQAKGSRWRRTSHGLYVPSHVDAAPVDQRILEAAAVLPAYGGVTGWAALRWAGGVWFDGLSHGGRAQLPVVVATSHCDVRHQPGIWDSSEGLDPGDLTELDGLRVTTAVRSVCFEMRYAATVRLAVVALDMAAYSDLVSIDEMRAYALTHSAWTGIPQCREAIDLADENSWSPREPPMRLIWTLDAGLPRPLCNAAIFDRSGRHIGTPDLFDPVAGVVGEYDGALHLEGAQRSRDLTREDRFRSHELEYVTMLAGDGPDPRGFIRRLLGAYDRAKWIPEARRSWTITPPPWWVPTATVAQRRALDPWQRQRLLRLRSG